MRIFPTEILVLVHSRLVQKTTLNVLKMMERNLHNSYRDLMNVSQISQQFLIRLRPTVPL